MTSFFFIGEGVYKIEDNLLKRTLLPSVDGDPSNDLKSVRAVFESNLVDSLLTRVCELRVMVDDLSQAATVNVF